MNVKNLHNDVLDWYMQNLLPVAVECTLGRVHWLWYCSECKFFLCNICFDNFQAIPWWLSCLPLQMLSSKDLNFMGYTYKNFEIVNDHVVPGIGIIFFLCLFLFGYKDKIFLVHTSPIPPLGRYFCLFSSPYNFILWVALCTAAVL